MTAVTADLLRALRGAGYHVDLNGDRLNVKPPASGMSTDLHARIAGHRDELKVLLASSDPLADCTPCDANLLVVDARRLDHDRLTALVTRYVDRYATTGNKVEVEIAAWFATTLEAQGRLADHDPALPPLDAADMPFDTAEIPPDDSGNDWDESEPASSSTEARAIWVCARCQLPRSRRPEPCPNCGAVEGRDHYPSKEAA